MSATRPSVSRSMRSIVGPASPWRRWTLATVRTDSGACPCSARMLLSAIEKQAACAAAMSSSGFVPSPSSKREANEYWPWKTPSPTVTSPAPPCRSPRHSALPFRVAIDRSSGRGCGRYTEPRTPARRAAALARGGGGVHAGAVKLPDPPWQLRVAAALLSASLLRMADGDAIWAGLLPDLLTAGALLAVLVMVAGR